MYSLRPATVDDYDFLRWLHRATLREYVDQTWGWDEDRQATLFRERFDPSRDQIVLVDGQHAGVLRVERREGGLFLASLLIAPAYQGHGVGTAILEDLKAEAARGSAPGLAGPQGQPGAAAPRAARTACHGRNRHALPHEHLTRSDLTAPPGYHRHISVLPQDHRTD